MSNPFQKIIDKVWQKTEQIEHSLINLREQKRKIRTDVYTDPVWQEISDRAEDVFTAATEKMEELNDDIVNLCLISEDYLEAYSDLVGRPETWGSQVNEQLAAKEELFSRIGQIDARFESEYHPAYDKYVKAKANLSRLVAPVTNYSQAQRAMDAYGTVITEAGKVEALYYEAIADYLAVRNEARAIPPILQGFVSTINGISWNKTNRCSSSSSSSSSSSDYSGGQNAALMLEALKLLDDEDLSDMLENTLKESN